MNIKKMICEKIETKTPFSLFYKTGTPGHNYECEHEDCGMTFLRRDELDRHMFQHTGIRSHKCDKDGCDKSYTTITHLKRHIQSFHSSQRCKAKYCDERFATDIEMLSHYENIHSVGKNYKCDECDKTFKKKYELKYHMYKHTNEYPYKCDICSKGFLLISKLNQHKDSHKEKTCLKCDQKFKLWTNLVEHQRTEHTETKCLKCDKVLKNKANLKAHMKIHEEKGDREVFPCEYEKCSKYYFNKKNLSNHIKVKHEELKFKCTFEGCEYALTTKQKLQKHLILHSNGKLKINRHRKKAHKSNTKKSKISTASKLAGVSNPPEVEKLIIEGDGKDLVLVGGTTSESEYSVSDADQPMQTVI